MSKTFIPSTETVFQKTGESTMVVNMGPQHPSTHGVLRIICELDGHEVLLGRMFGVARRLASDEGLAGRGYRLAFNVGPEGGQTIYHLHLHLLGGRQLGPEG